MIHADVTADIGRAGVESNVVEVARAGALHADYFAVLRPALSGEYTVLS